MSINKLIPITDIIYDTFEDMGIDINADLPTFERWALKAEGHIASYYSLKKKTIVGTAVGCMVKLPKEVRIVRAVVSGDCGCECGDLIENLILNNLNGTTYSQNQVYLSIDKPDGDNFQINPLKYDILDNSIVFNQNMNGQKFTIQTMSNDVDCDGRVRVNENHDEAIGAYLEYKFAKRSRYSPNKMDRGEVQQLKIDWYMARDGARADDSKLNQSDRDRIVDMLHDPYIGWGLRVGMYNPTDNYGIH